jgi:O-antigen ligase
MLTPHSSLRGGTTAEKYGIGTAGSLANEAAIKLTRPSVGQAAAGRSAQLLDPAIFFTLLALIALVAIPYGSVQPWWESAFECAVFGLAGLWVVDSLRSDTSPASGHRLLAPLIAIIILAFSQTISLGGAAPGIKGEMWRAVSADPYETRRFALKLLALSLAGMLLLRYTSNQRRLRTLIHVLISVGVASALFGIVRQMVQGSTPYLALPQLSPDRSYAQFIDRNHFAFLIEMVLGLVFGLMIGGGIERERRLIYLVAALFLCAALVLSNSRGGILTMLCQMLFLAPLFGVTGTARASYREGNSLLRGWLPRLSSLFLLRTALILSLLTAVTIGIIWVGGDPLIHRIGTVPREFSTNDDDKRMNTRRVEIWQATWGLIKAHPIAGIGFGGYWIAFPEKHDASGVFTPEEAQFRPLAAHNEYLELLASGGLIGGVLGTWFVVVLIRCAREHLRRSRDPFRRAASLGALIGLFGVAIHSLVDFGLHDTVNALVFTALVVIATVTLKEESSRNESDGSERDLSARWKSRRKAFAHSPS